YLGAAIRDECGLDDDMRMIGDVPSRSLLSRLTDHYMQIIANRAPIGFEAEFVNQRSENICYRGILMPFSSDGDAIDFIYGVINWKTVAEELAAAASDDVPETAEQTAELLLEEEAAAEAVAFEPAPEPMDEPVSLEPAAVQAEDHYELEQEAPAESFAEAPEEIVEPTPAPIHFAWEDGPLADTDD